MENKVKQQTKINKKKTEVKEDPMSVTLYSKTGEETGKIELPKNIFGQKPNKSLIAQAVRVYLANQRSGTAKTKTRAEVRGGGRKPWRQKGTGRARAGSIRDPHWRGGGVVHGPQPRDYSLEMPKKMRKSALISALSDKFANKKITVIEEINFKEPKTKEAVNLLKKLDLKGKNLIVADKFEEKEKRALGNLEKIKTFRANDLNTYEVLNYTKMLITKAGIESLRNWGEKE